MVNEHSKISKKSVWVDSTNNKVIEVICIANGHLKNPSVVYTCDGKTLTMTLTKFTKNFNIMFTFNEGLIQDQHFENELKSNTTFYVETIDEIYDTNKDIQTLLVKVNLGSIDKKRNIYILCEIDKHIKVIIKEKFPDCEDLIDKMNLLKKRIKHKIENQIIIDDSENVKYTRNKNRRSLEIRKGAMY